MIDTRTITKNKFRTKDIFNKPRKEIKLNTKT